jgi:zinc resistance-associated protein
LLKLDRDLIFLQSTSLLEETMWKTVLAGGTALAIAGSSFVYAQQRNDAAPSPDVQRQWRPGAQDMGAFIDARVAAIKAGLQLTPDQEKNWPAFEQAYRDLAKLRAERMAARFERRGEDRRDGDRDVNPIDRMGRRADSLIARGTALKHYADAAGPLYQSLDEGQKHRFTWLSRPMGPRHHEHFAFWRMHRGEGEER